MAQRVVLPVVGTSMAPYGSHGPMFQTGNISENQSYDVINLGRGVDTPATVRAQYPFALSYVNVINQDTKVANFTRGRRLYLSITSAALNTLVAS